MKKKLKIVGVALAVVLVSAALSVGILALIRGRNVAETGNILGVSWYDPSGTEFTITTVEELYEFASLSDFYTFEGQTVKLGADMIVNEGNVEDWILEAPEKRWKPIDQFAGTFDGQGHTISGVYGRTLQTPMALFVNTKKNATIQEFSLVNSYFKNAGAKGTASISANGDGTFVKIYSDAIIDCQGENGGGIASHVKAQSTFDECWFDGTIVQTGRYLGGIVGNITNGRATIRHSLFSGKITSQHDNANRDGNMVGGIVGSNAKTANVLISDSLASGTVEAGYSTYVATMIGVNYSGGTVVMTDTYDNVESSYQTMIGGSATAQAMKIGTEELLGVKAYQWTTLDFDNYWATVENDTPTLKYFTENPLDLAGVEKAYDTSWFTPGTFNFTLTNLKQLYGFYMLSNSESFEAMIIKLGADIVVNEGNAEDWMKDPSKAPANPWYAIGSRAVPFKGSFDGQGHTISGIYLDTNQNYNGLFGYVEKGTSIRNLKLTNSYYRLTNSDELYGVGGIVGETRGIIDSVYTDVIIETNAYQAGGIAGRMVYLDGTYISKCSMNNTWFDGKLILRDNGRYAGGLAGYVGIGSNMNYEKCTMDFSNCLSTGYISADRTGSSSVFDKSVSKGGQSIGGLIGQNNGEIVVNITDCLYAGQLDLQYGTYSGSVVGRLNKGGIYNIENTYTIADGYLLKGKKSDKVYDIHGEATLNGGATIMPTEFLTGMNGYKYTELNFDKYWAVVTDDTPILKSFAGKVPSLADVERLVDTSWYKTDAKELIINNAKQFYGFWLKASSDDFEGKTVKLGADIIINNADAATVQAWMNGTATPANTFLPIGSSNTPFKGTFDGQGHTINGIYMESDQNRVGLFAMTAPGSMLKNFKLTNSFFNYSNSNDFYGQAAIAGEVRGSIDTVYTNATVLTTGYQVGGITGRVVYTDKTHESKLQVNNVWFDGQLIMKDNSRYGGGIAGYLSTGSGIEKDKCSLDFSNCLTTGLILSDRKGSADKFDPETSLGGQSLGGLLGQNNGSVVVNLKDSLNAGTMDLQYGTYAGAVIGRMNTKGVFNLENVYSVTDSMYVKGVANSRLYEVHANAVVSGSTLVVPDAMLNGLNSVKYTSLDFAKYWAAIENDSPVLKSFASGALDSSTTKNLIDTSWFDEKKTTMVIDSVEDLYGFWQIGSYYNFNGKTIELGKDIKVNGDWVPSIDADGKLTNIPDNQWLPIGSNTNRFAGTFDGKGNTISGIYMDVNQNYVGLFGATATGSVIKNLSLTNSYIDALDAYECYGIGSIIGEMRGTMDTVKSDAIINTIGKQVGGLAGRVLYADKTFATKTGINNSWFDGAIYLHEDGRYAGGIAGYTSYSGVTKADKDKYTIDYTNCLNTGYIFSDRTGAASTKDPKTSFGGQYIGGLLGGTDGTLTLVVKDSLMSGDIDVTYNTYVGAVVSRINHNGTYKITNTYATNESYELKRLYNDKTETGTLDAKEFKLINAADAVNYYAYYSTDLDYKDEWMAQKTDMPTLRSFADASQEAVGSADWYKKGSSPYIINTAEEFDGFRVVVNNGYDFNGETVKLGRDITLDKNSKWTPIGLSAQIYFDGEFDGNNKTISGMNINVDGKTNIGLFGYAGPNSTLRDFKLIDSTIKVTGSSGNVAAVVGVLKGNLQNIYVGTDVSITAADAPTAGIAGIFDSPNNERTISNCWFAGTVTNTSTRTGGIIGRAYKGTLTIENCLNTGSLTAKEKVGGLVGSPCGENADKRVSLTIKNSVSTGNVTATSGKLAGAIMGSANDANVKIENVYAVSNLDGIGSVGPETAGKVFELKGVPNILTKNELTGNNAYINTILDLTGNVWQVATDGTPELATFATATAMTSFNGQKISKEWYYNSLVNASSGDSWILKGNFKVATVSDMYGLAHMVNEGIDNFNGETITLTTSIDFNPDWNVSNKLVEGGRVWQPIGKGTSNVFKGTFNGGNNEISGLYVSDTSNSTGLFGDLYGTVKNLKMTNSYICSSGYMVGGIAGRQCTNTIENVYVDDTVVVESTNANGVVGGIVGRFSYDKSNRAKEMSNCWSAATVKGVKRIGGIIGQIWYTSSDKYVLSNSLFTGTVQSTTGGAGGIIGHMDDATIINDCVSNGKVCCSVSSNLGPVYGEGKASNLTTTNVYVVNKVYELDGITEKAITSTATGYTSVTVEQLKGANVATYTELDLCEDDYVDGVWVATAVGPELKQFSTKTAVLDLPGTCNIATRWYHEAQENADGVMVYSINTAKDLHGLSKIVNDGKDAFAGDIVQLTADIKLNGDWVPVVNAAGEITNTTDLVEWIPISHSDEGPQFAGTFNGNYHSIHGIYVVTNYDRAGLFGITNTTANICNLKVANSYIAQSSASSYYTGSVAGTLRGTMSNVYVDTTVTVKGITGSTGGIVGMTSEKTVTKKITACWFAGSIYATGGRVGGICARAYNGPTEIENCLFTGIINSTVTGTANVGGIVGVVDTGNSQAFKISSCLSKGTINVYSIKRVGDIIGSKNASDDECSESDFATLFTAGIKQLYSSGALVSNPSFETTGVVNGTVIGTSDYATVFANNASWAIGSEGYPVPAWTVAQ